MTSTSPAFLPAGEDFAAAALKTIMHARMRVCMCMCTGAVVGQEQISLVGLGLYSDSYMFEGLGIKDPHL